MPLLSRFPFHAQHDTMDCGPACLKMIGKYYKKEYSMNMLRRAINISRAGVSISELDNVAISLGFDTIAGKVKLETLIEEAPLPAIIHWKNNHFVVLYKISKFGEKYHIADPAIGLLTYSKKNFLNNWISVREENEGIALFLEPSDQYDIATKSNQLGLDFSYLLTYLLQHKKLLVQLFCGLAVSSLLQLLFPYLTQVLVDSGVKTHNLNIIYLVLVGQMILFASRTITDFIRNWILLHIGSKINVSILSDFFIKLMKLPISFFDTKMFGDLMQRVNDHNNIEKFLTGTTISTIFSLINLIAFTFVLSFYKIQILITFIIGSIIYISWVILLLGKRKIIEYKRSDIESKSQSLIIQLLQGMQDIKLSNSEKSMRWNWENVQASLFKVKIKSTSLIQYQQGGAFFINEGRNIIITFLSAKSVIMGQLTLGEMLSIQYIIGQLNSPIEQLIVFMQTAQDAKIGLERLNEIHSIEEEHSLAEESNLVNLNSDYGSINYSNVSFSYPNTVNTPVLRNVSINVGQGQFVAIVGSSGSGKTTLLKLLLRFYKPSEGCIKVGEHDINDGDLNQWRSQCGVVMQDGFIFSDTIANNIALGEEVIDGYKLQNAIETANLKEYIQSLPLGHHTIIGAEGNGISQGQKQRILIARAIYKQPKLLLFDEATNALDAKNESAIMSNLSAFIAGRTAIVVAHRLSTVKQADIIYVLHNGLVVEQGNHAELIDQKGVYYNLVRNQIQLDSL